jgi:hypothetical protein
MKKLLLTGVAVLILATGTAHAEGGKWEGDFRKCEIVKIFPKVEQNPDANGILHGELDYQGISITADSMRIGIQSDEIADIERGIRLLKKCKAFWQCVADREAGKVKHCYDNDRRWR